MIEEREAPLHQTESGRLLDMKTTENREAGREQPADRLSRMAEAWLRIASNLDVDAVLQEVIDGARSLTGARYGALVSFDDSGGIRDLVTSGMSTRGAPANGGAAQGAGSAGIPERGPQAAETP